MTDQQLAVLTGRSDAAVQAQRYKLKLIGPFAPPRWSVSEYELLREFKPLMSYRQIGELLGISVRQVDHGMARAGLCDQMLRTPWTEKEDAELRRTYPDLRTAEVAQRIGRGEKPTEMRARRLGLTKSPAYLVTNGRSYQLLSPELRKASSLANTLRKELKNARRQCPE